MTKRTIQTDKKQKKGEDSLLLPVIEKLEEIRMDEDSLLLPIIEKLEEIRCAIIDIETAVLMCGTEVMTSQPSNSVYKKTGC